MPFIALQQIDREFAPLPPHDGGTCRSGIAAGWTTPVAGKDVQDHQPELFGAVVHAEEDRPGGERREFLPPHRAGTNVDFDLVRVTGSAVDALDALPMLAGTKIQLIDEHGRRA